MPAQVVEMAMIWTQLTSSRPARDTALMLLFPSYIFAQKRKLKSQNNSKEMKNPNG